MPAIPCSARMSKPIATQSSAVWRESGTGKGLHRRPDPEFDQLHTQWYGREIPSALSWRVGMLKRFFASLERTAALRVSLAAASGLALIGLAPTPAGATAFS